MEIWEASENRNALDSPDLSLFFPDDGDIYDFEFSLGNGKIPDYSVSGIFPTFENQASGC